MRSLWYRDAVIYQVYLPAFFDTDADGVGDLPGLAQKLNYLEKLGVSVIWILGLPGGDGSNDRSSVEKDFKAFVEKAHARKMRVIATVDPGVPSEEGLRDEAEAQDRTVRSSRVWLDCGADGVDVHVLRSPAAAGSPSHRSSIHRVLKHLRAFLERAYPNRILIAEANQRPEDAAEYFGHGDECHLTFNIGLGTSLLLALTTEDVRWLVDFVREQPELPALCQWALFLRNHNELAFGAYSERERDEIRRAYAVDPQMQLNGGVRRRLAPLFDNDRRRIELAYGLLLSLPGTPVLYYGNEIGMGDNIYLPDRVGMRTPMQWSPDRNAGFSHADPERLYGATAAPANADPVYGRHVVNVESQERQAYSLLNWMRRLVAIRNTQHAFGRGTIEFIEARNAKILAYIRRHGDSQILVVANLAGTAQSVELLLGRWAGSQPIEMLGGARFRRIGATPYALSFAPYGFYWFALMARAKRDVPPLYREGMGISASGGPGVAA